MVNSQPGTGLKFYRNGGPARLTGLQRPFPAVGGSLYDLLVSPAGTILKPPSGDKFLIT